MKIVKEYNLLELSSVVKRAIEYSHKANIKGASIDIIKAQEIVEVLERIAELEEIQKETEGGQMELHSKTDSNGNILRGISVEALRQIKTKERNETLCNDCLMSCCHVDCKNEHITKQMLGDLVKCFGKSYGKNDIVVCETCKYKEQCEVLTKHE